MEDPLSGPRMLTIGCLGAIVFWAGILYGVCVVVEAKADGRLAHMACNRPVLPMPRTVVIRPGVNAQPWRNAIVEWNAFAQRVVGSNRLQFVEVNQDYEADVYILPDSRTWVELPCGWIESVIHSGANVNLNYWAAHELGHTLGLADHIQDTVNPSAYINPGVCPIDSYVGIMSYCTDRGRWWGVDDIRSIQWWF